MEYENIVQSKVALLCQRIETAFDKPGDGSIDLGRAFRAMSVDIVTDYAFSSSLGLLEEDDFGAWFSNMLREGAPLFWVFQQLPFIKTAVESLPAWVSRRLSPAVGAWERFMQVCVSNNFSVYSRHARHSDKFSFVDCAWHHACADSNRNQKALTNLQAVQADMAAGIKPKRRTMFHHMLDPQVPEGRIAPSDSNPADEAMSLTAAGADSTGNAASYAIFHVLTDPAMHERVMRELKEAFPDPNEACKVAVLEKLPLFTGVVKEAQRMSYGVIGRIPRRSPQAAHFNGYDISAGTTTSMSTWTMHRNAAAFPDPDRFDPERWLTKDAEQLHLMDRCFVPFGKGPRMCLGHALATCELFCAIGTVLRNLRQWRC
jgi:hypothetical protein